MDELIQEILSRDPSTLKGEDLLIFNFAHQLQAHPTIEWTNERISALMTDVESYLDVLEE